MEENKKSFFNDNDEDAILDSTPSQSSNNEIDYDIVESNYMRYMDEFIGKASRNIHFRQTASIESYRTRGFIKDGELVAEPMKLFLDETDGTIEKVTVADGRLLICRENGDCSHRSIYITEEGVPSSVDDIEKQLITALTEYSDKFNARGVSVYAFAHFYEPEVAPIVPTDYVEFKGCYEFINMPQGWMLFRHHRAVRLSEESEL